MIDWISAFLPLKHKPLFNGKVFSIDQDGQVEWEKPKRMEVTGSYEDKYFIESHGADDDGHATHLYVSGNPSKFLQGHNVFGSDDLILLMIDVYSKLTEFLEVKPSEFELHQVSTGNYRLTRIDINYSFSLPTQEDVQTFIRAMEFKASSRSGRAERKGTTLYLQKGSKRWMIKMYSKLLEIMTKRGRLPECIQGKGIEQWAQNKLRIELQLRSKELDKLELTFAKTLTKDKVASLFDDYLGRIKMSRQIRLTNEVMAKMPNKLRLTYIAWSQGEDLRQLMSQSTYTRHKKELFDNYGINISLTPENLDKSNIIPLVRVLQAKEESVPDFAYHNNLVHWSASTF